ncbi:hypothetical protein CGCVW01_v002637 [Colletotrichum viniferum]|nr:hypothetical protein CGCVW01_v002637 [Colletotrichum viniferum]
MAELRAAVYVAPPISAKVPGRDTTIFWSPISCTLAYSAREAVLVDTPITIKQTEELIAWIEKVASNRKLSYAYFTHGHIDHWAGPPLLLKRQRLYRSRPSAPSSTWNRRSKKATSIKSGSRVFPALHNHMFKLEDRREFHAIECGHSDTYASTVLWQPNLKLVACGYVIYGQVHQMLYEANTKAKRDE